MVAGKHSPAGIRHGIQRRGRNKAPRQRFNDAPGTEQISKLRRKLFRFNAEFG